MSDDYLDSALDDLDAAELRAVKVAAFELAQRSNGEGMPRRAAVWHALSVLAAGAEDRRTATLRRLEDDLLGLPGNVTFGED